MAGTDLSPSWIYASFNNGATYSPYSEGLSEVASVEVIASNDTYIFAGTNYQGVWLILIPGVNAGGFINPPNKFLLVQNYPNPFNPSTKIKFTIPVGTRRAVSLRIYDVLGNEVATWLTKNKPAGTYEVEFDADRITKRNLFLSIKG